MTTLTLFPSERAEASGPMVGHRVSRATDVHNVHAYHTKVPVAAIAPHILKHSAPGNSLFDPFCGSGMTGVAANQLGRRAYLSDLSPAAVHIATNYTAPCSPTDYSSTVARVMSLIQSDSSTLYATTCHSCHGPATIGYLVWSDERACPSCGDVFRVWDHRNTGLRTLTCHTCGAHFRKSQATITGEQAVLAVIDCGRCGRLEREPIESDVFIGRRRDIPYWYPDIPFGSDREMWRAGHKALGITSVADFYSTRNLWALASIHNAVEQEANPRARAALMFTFTAIVNRASRRYQWNAKRPTNVLGGTLYVSSLRYEFNVFGLWRRKVAAVLRYFISRASNTVAPATVIRASATRLPYADQSMDYCFTDPHSVQTSSTQIARSCGKHGWVI